MNDFCLNHYVTFVSLMYLVRKFKSCFVKLNSDWPVLFPPLHAEC